MSRQTSFERRLLTRMNQSELPALARLAVETFVRTGKQNHGAGGRVRAPFGACGLFRFDQNSSGDLRGCIGTIEPTKQNLAEELIANAINAASRDPRFDPVSRDELAGLRYSVDILRRRSQRRLRSSIQDLWRDR